MKIIWLLIQQTRWRTGPGGRLVACPCAFSRGEPMGRRRAGMALLCLALVLPAATAQAKSVETPKVLVVTSTQDAVTTAGLAAINSAASSGAFTVTAPAPANVGAEF